MNTSLIFDGLNNKQLESVKAVSGSNLIIAGAGSGKTSVLTKRVAYLISEGTIPGTILCLTFTNKAAKEMRFRVFEMLKKIGLGFEEVPVWKNDYLNQPLLSTFHSLGVRLLREFGQSINLSSNFTILNTDDQKKIVKDILKELNIDQKNLQPSLALYFISLCKQELLLAKDSAKCSKEFLPVFHKIYNHYEKYLQENQVVDFDDLILLSYIILNNNPEIQEVLQNRWHHIMVDEFQDTNPAQFAIIKLLCPPKILENQDRSLLVVGDDAQSIYGFRGSKIEIILNFEREYPNTKEVVLNQNYRSTQAILDLAEKILTHNPFQKKKDLFTENPEQVDVRYYLARSEKDEAEYIIKQIYNTYVEPKNLTEQTSELSLEVEEYFEKPELFLKPKEKQADSVSNMFDVYLEMDDFRPTGFSNYSPDSWSVPEYDWSKIEDLNNCVVLYRTHSQSRSIEETFLKYQVPYRLVSGVKFLDRKEVRDVISLLKSVANPEDTINYSRWLPLVTTGIGAKTLDKINAFIRDNSYPLAPKYQQIISEINQKIEKLKQAHTSITKFTKELLLGLGYHNYLKQEYPLVEERQAREENIGEIYSLMLPYEEQEGDLLTKLSQFLEQISLMSGLDEAEDDNTPKISLMSLHQSKGLEFETVFLVGLEDGLLPHQNSLLEPGGFAEEVRLAYVGVTRAKKYLHLLAADSRIQFGQIKANPVSRIFRPFLDTACQRVIL